MKKLIVIGGPTASGKSDLALELAKTLNCEIFSADSRQIYKELEIGTAKPTAAELSSVKHHFINHISIEDEYNVFKYQEEILEALNKTFSNHEYAVLVGGTGLYLRAVMEGLDEIPDVPKEIEDQVTNEYNSNGLDNLVLELKSKDPIFSENADLQNPYRVIRAIALIRHTGKTFSSFRTNTTQIRPFEIHPFLVHVDRPKLYERINARVDVMIENGLEYEAKKLFKYKDFKSLQTVGYQEWFEYFIGNISREKAIELIKRNSRRYAKRQGTWFRKYGSWTNLPEELLENKVSFILNRI